MTKSPISTADTADIWTSKRHGEVVARVADRVWGYLQNDSRVGPGASLLAGLTCMPGEDIDLVVDRRVLVNPSTAEFVDVLVPALLRQWAKAVVTDIESGLGAVRGAIHWPSTVRYRLEQGGVEAAGFSWRRQDRDHDLPENRLVKLVLLTLRGIADAVARDEERTADRDEERPSDIAASLRTRIDRLLQTQQLVGVSGAGSINDVMRGRARTHRNPRYRRAAAYEDWLTRVRGGDAHLRRDVLAKAFLVPLSTDTLFELFVLTKLIDALEGDDWRLRRISAVGGSRRPVFELNRGTLSAAVFYQHTPAVLATASGYVRHYGRSRLSVQLRRPDIVLVVTGGDMRWIGLVEVKNSRSRQYVADGVYKCFAYLRDFRDAIDGQSVELKAFLISWSAYSDATDLGLPVIRLSASALRHRLQVALAAVRQTVWQVPAE